MCLSNAKIFVNKSLFSHYLQVGFPHKLSSNLHITQWFVCEECTNAWAWGHVLPELRIEAQGLQGNCEAGRIRCQSTSLASKANSSSQPVFWSISIGSHALVLQHWFLLQSSSSIDSRFPQRNHEVSEEDTTIINIFYNRLIAHFTAPTYELYFLLKITFSHN